MTNNPLTYHHLRSDSFDGLEKTLRWLFEKASHEVHTERWQGWDISKKPEMVSKELLNVTSTVSLRGIESIEHWQADINPSLPWADDHFEERVCGVPINPGRTWAKWPWAGSAAAQLQADGGMFNHNYMERYWPKYAGGFVLKPDQRGPIETPAEWFSRFDNSAPEYTYPNRGIRSEYGDLNDLVKLLANEPLTRQAWIPIFFPEDTGSEGRKPCTLGYQFIMRENQLHVYYPLRSCDFIRHWADDCYLTVRLLLWVLDEVRKINPAWNSVKPGQFTMQATSLHVFMNDWRQSL